MGGEITITDDGEASKQGELNRLGKRPADAMAQQLLGVYRAEMAGKGKFKGNLAGSGDERTQGVFGQINEFTPRTIGAKVGEKVTSTMIGHNLSFNVPSTRRSTSSRTTVKSRSTSRSKGPRAAGRAVRPLSTSADQRRSP